MAAAQERTPGPRQLTGRRERLLTVKDVAERDQCSEKTVRRAIAAGLLVVTRIGPSGRAIRITEAAYAHYHGLR